MLCLIGQSVVQTKEEAICDIMPNKNRPFNTDMKTKKYNFHETLFLLLPFPEI